MKDDLNKHIKRLYEKSIPLKTGSLMTGNMGLALLMILAKDHLKEIKPIEKFSDIIISNIEYIINDNQKGYPFSFGDGITGLNYLISKFKNTIPEIDLIDNKTLLSIEEMISATIKAQLNCNDFGFMNGAAGNLFYLLKRAKESPIIDTRVKQHLKDILKHAIIDKDGLRFQPGQLHSYWTVKGFENHYNLSMRDGLVGILLVMIKAYEIYGNIFNLDDMIFQGVKFILGLERNVNLDDKKYCYYPTIVSPIRDIRQEKKEFYNSRLGWCGGDLSVSYLLCSAGNILNDSFLKEKGNEVAEFTLLRKTNATTKVVDNTWCHGSSGIAMIYKKLFMLTNNNKFIEDGFNYWIQMVNIDMMDSISKRADLSLLSGLTGELITYYDSEGVIEDDWTDIFLL